MGSHFPKSGGGLAARLLAAAAAVCLVSGCTALPTRSRQVWRSFINYNYPSEPAGGPAFEAALDRHTGSAARAGSAVRLLQNGDEAYPAMLGLIDSARERISFETYIIGRDEITDRFLGALREAAARGVRVRMLVDAAGFQRGLVAQLDELRGDNIETRVFNSYFLSWTIVRGNNRDHRKILVVDGQHAVMGGINLSDRQLGDGVSGWRDTSLLVSGPAALDAERVFAETWEQGGPGWLGKTLPLPSLTPLKLALDAPFLNAADRFEPAPPTEPSGEPEAGGASALVRVVSSSPDRRDSPTYDLAILGVLGARERLDVACAYFVPPLSLRRALLAAAGGGVRVRLLLPGVTDVKWVREIGMRFYGDLLRAGARIYEWPHPILHAKTMAVDGRWLVVGSANMDSRSYFLNYEACFAVSDPGLAEEAHARFESDIATARELTLEEWKARGAGQRLLETLFTPLAGQY